PDERELYVVDWPDYVHVFDVSGVPGRPPQQVADILLTPSMNHSESPCQYDCLADGWLQHSRDGRFVYVGDQGDVIDTATRRAVTNLPTLSNTRKMIEIDGDNGVPVFAATARASVGYVGALPCGDVNGDGVVNIADALVVSQYDVGLRTCRSLPHPEL